MNSFKRISVSTFAALLPLLFAACINTDYQAITELDPLPEDSYVEVCYAEAKLPVRAEKMVKVGTITAKSSTASHKVNDMRNKIIKTALKHGGNVVLFTSVDYIPDGEARADQLRNTSEAIQTEPVDNNRTDIQTERNKFFEGTNNNPEIPVFKVVMKAVIYRAPDGTVKRPDPMQKRIPQKPAKTDKEVNLRIH